ncbi:hypothetical protein PPERSA_08211 [Pseudocohnilembus persalinus]|uniref:Uncharacterized protein n=1 Tax=Pseudocohnilembus persalinus TaxID=266149 RepID=A0A0V0QFX7_PSEPJ|nr:hypothetical protein PPERSA_08211 [Pseudocohnilembus persalinus]|eukprot:KRX01110.1 hypothetical protein PPERSA_08211 [Pseudocohnilembus persalinus]
MQSNTDSHACTNCLCQCYDDPDFDVNSIGDSSCICSDCGQIYGEIQANDINDYQDNEFEFPDGLEVQNLSQSMSPESQNNDQIQQLVFSKRNINKKSSKINEQQKIQHKQHKQQQNNFSKSPPKNAPIEIQIAYQQQKVRKIQSELELQNQKNVKLEDHQEDSDRESPENYNVQASQLPFRERENITAKELAIRNNMIYKQKKLEEEEKKKLLQQKLDFEKQKLKAYNNHVKNLNQAKLQDGKKVEKQKYAWGVDQQYLQQLEKPAQKKECLTKKPEEIEKYNHVSNFFDGNQSKWLEKIHQNVKQELNSIKKPKKQPRRRSLDLERGIDELKQKPFQYLRSKSTLNKQQLQNYHQQQLQEENEDQNQKVKIQQREEEAKKALILEPKIKKKREKSQKEKKLKELEEKSKAILLLTKKIPFKTEEELEQEKFKNRKNLSEFGDISLTRFNLKSQNNNNQYNDQQGSEYNDNDDQDMQQNDEYNTDEQDNYQQQLKYNEYKKNLNDNYNDEFSPKQRVNKIFGQDLNQNKVGKQKNRQKIGFQNNNDVENEHKSKKSDKLIEWSKKKTQQERLMEKRIEQEEEIQKLKQERDKRKSEKQKENQLKMQNQNQFDDYGYNKETGQYDPFFDKYRKSNYNLDNDQYEQQDQLSENEFEKQLQEKQNKLKDIDSVINSKTPYKQNQFYNNRTQEYQNMPQNAEFNEILDEKQYQNFLKKSKLQQDQIRELMNEKTIKIKDLEPYTKQEKEIQGSLKFMDKNGKPLPDDYVKQIMDSAQIQDLQVQNEKKRLYPKQDKSEQMEEYYKQIEQEVKKKIYDKKDRKTQDLIKKKMNKHKKSHTNQGRPPIELRKKLEWEKQQMEVDRLRVPDLDQIFKEKEELRRKQKNKDYLEGEEEMWDEFDDRKLQGTRNNWDEIKLTAKNDLYELDSDSSDIYIQSKKKKKQSQQDYDQLEVLEKIERFNDQKVRKNLQQHKHKRVPFDTGDITGYSERCQNWGEKKQEYDEIASTFKPNIFNDDESEDDRFGEDFQVKWK